ncbi:MAG: hypothetical protein ETSY1_30760 [Candidatus Entotheonella factor]|uniref:Uncharacterized protein n=1 Tax=Entotheonella factor TaxID=1429438 RepID=W4LBQ5_ENTF1|nr:MAG: hypothetical protein ETSY1_30760 [Candidatus Entotheonella factor]
MPQTARHRQCAQSPGAPTMRFCPNVAAAIGVSEAIILHRLDYWLSRSKHWFKGRAWVYNTYDAWHEQFFFLSMSTVQTTFRRLEHLGVIESSQALNRSRWDKTKWYTIDYGRLAELVPQTAAAEGPVNDAPVEPPSMAGQASTDEAASVTIDGAESPPSWKTMGSSMNYSIEISNRACEGEPEEEARQPALETAEPEVPSCHLGAEAKSIEMEAVVNELDMAYEAIPEAERGTWYERADRALEAAGMAEWMRITAVVKEAALKLWVGSTIPAFASG